MELPRTTTSQLLEFIPRTSLTVISGGHVVSIAFGSILSIRSHGIHTLIHTAEKEYKTAYSLQELLRELPVNDFFRISRSRIVCRKLLGTVHLTKHYRQIAIEKLKNILDQSISFYQQS